MIRKLLNWIKNFFSPKVTDLNADIEKRLQDKDIQEQLLSQAEKKQYQSAMQLNNNRKVTKFRKKFIQYTPQGKLIRHKQ